VVGGRSPHLHPTVAPSACGKPRRFLTLLIRNTGGGWMSGRSTRRSTDRSRRDEVVRAVRRIEERMHSEREAKDREFDEMIERRLHRRIGSTGPLAGDAPPAPGL
jgi:hypothetical protein